jgi:hypothetical protein
MSAAVAATAALAGCTSVKADSGASAHAATRASASASPAAAAVSNTQLTGTQLTAALLTTTSDLPIPGFSVTSKTDSGGSLTTAKAKFALSTLSCADQQNDLGVPGFGETAMSSNAMLNAANKDVVSQIVYQFADPTAANDFFATLKARWNSCGTFSITWQNTDAKLTVTVVTAKAGVGQQDFANTMTGTISGTTYALASTVALDGPDVLVVGASKVGSTVSTDIDSGGLLAKLIRKIAAAA